MRWGTIPRLVGIAASGVVLGACAALQTGHASSAIEWGLSAGLAVLAVTMQLPYPAPTSGGAPHRPANWRTGRPR